MCLKSGNRKRIWCLRSGNRKRKVSSEVVTGKELGVSKVVTGKELCVSDLVTRKESGSQCSAGLRMPGPAGRNLWLPWPSLPCARPSLTVVSFSGYQIWDTQFFSGYHFWETRFFTGYHFWAHFSFPVTRSETPLSFPVTTFRTHTILRIFGETLISSYLFRFKGKEACHSDQWT